MVDLATNATGTQASDLISRFVRWWLGELQALVPKRFTRSRTRDKEQICLDFVDGGLSLVKRSRNDETVLQSFDDVTSGALTADALKGATRRTIAATKTAVIRFDPADVLIRRVTLPAAVEQDLAGTLALQLERLAPLPARDAVFDCEVIEVDRGAGVIVVDLAVMRKTVLDRAMTLAGDLGISIRGAGLRDTDSEFGARFDFLSGVRARQRPASSRTVQALVILIVIALGGLLWAIEDRRSREIDMLNDYLAELREDSANVRALREEVSGLVAQQEVFAKRQSVPPVSLILNELTRVLPDTAYVVDVQITDNTVRIQGFAADAASLVPLIENSAFFAGIEFRSPVTRRGQQTRERFDLAFEARQEGAS